MDGGLVTTIVQAGAVGLAALLILAGLRVALRAIDHLREVGIGFTEQMNHFGGAIRDLREAILLLIVSNGGDGPAQEEALRKLDIELPATRSRRRS